MQDLMMRLELARYLSARITNTTVEEYRNNVHVVYKVEFDNKLTWQDVIDLYEDYIIVERYILDKPLMKFDYSDPEFVTKILEFLNG